MRKERVTISMPGNVVRAIDNIPGWSRSAFIAHVMSMYLDQLVAHYKINPIEPIKIKEKTNAV